MRNAKKAVAVSAAGIAAALGIAVSVIYAVLWRGQPPLAGDVGNSGEADCLGTPYQQGVFLQGRDQLVSWFSRTNLRYQSR